MTTYIYFRMPVIIISNNNATEQISVIMEIRDKTLKTQRFHICYFVQKQIEQAFHRRKTGLQNLEEFYGQLNN